MTTRDVVAPGRLGVALYRVLPCPKCENRAFSFVGKNRRCDGSKGCGHVWDPGDEGREKVGRRS